MANVRWMTEEELDKLEDKVTIMETEDMEYFKPHEASDLLDRILDAPADAKLTVGSLEDGWWLKGVKNERSNG